MRPTLLLTLLLLSLPTQAADRSTLLEAEQSYAQGRLPEARQQVDAYLATNDTDARAHLLRAVIKEASNDRQGSLADYDKSIALDPKFPPAWQRRGVAHFMLGHIKESIADFDHYLDLVPDAKPDHWQRGIALYYAGRYEDGAKQFELHKTVNPDDVENAAWHFACLARANSPAAARAALIPIEGDPRVPMAQIHQMFAGKATPADVLTAATANNPTPNELNRHLFYAHLYIALYCESTGKDEEAKKHLTESLKHEVPDYMYGVAKVHAQLRKWPPAKM